MVGILELAEQRVRLKKVATTKGGEYQGPCPGCGGKDRFHVWPEQNVSEDGTTTGSYWCRQCGKGGDCIQFLRDFEGLSFHQACERIGKGMDSYRQMVTPRSPRSGQAWQPVNREASVDLEEPELWKEKAANFVKWGYENIFTNSEILTWLQVRGISEDSISRFGLGWNSGKDGKDLFRPRESWGLSKLKNDNGKARRLWLPVGMVIPNFVENRVCRIRIRRSGETLSFGARYYVVPGSDMATMVVRPLEDNKREVFVIVESELDAVLLAQEAGDIAGVVALGSSSTKPDTRATAVLRDAVCILVALDFDKAGGQAWQWWKKEFPDCERWPVPVGKDPGEAYQAGVNIKEWVRAGLPEGLKIDY